MDIVTIDFETYYDKDFSLSKMTTEAYVRDPRFEVIGVGVKINNNPTDTYSGSNVGRFLNSLDYSDKAILAHNTYFDGLILSYHYGIQPRLWLDTMSMSRPIYKLTVGGSLAKLAEATGVGTKGDEVVRALGKRKADFTEDELSRYMDYCANDVELTYKLFKKLAKQIPASQLYLIDLIIRMYTDPVLELDHDILRGHLDKVVETKNKLLNKLGTDPEKLRAVLSSNPKFAKLLTALGVEPPMKVSKTTGKETYAFAKTDKGLLDLQEHPNPAVQAVVGARLGVKSTIEETRTEALIGVSTRGPLPVYLNYYGAHTGRLSGGDGLNLQNLPSRAGKAIREAICAPDGHLLVVCDLSQIEARVVAYMAGQKDLVHAFREGRDVYSEFASTVYGRKVTKENKKERFVGKTCILGLGYGMGGAKLAHTLYLGQGGMNVELTEDEAKEIVNIYRRTYPDIAALWRRSDKVLDAVYRGQVGSFAQVLEYDQRGIRLTNGMYLHYPELQPEVSDNKTRWKYINNPREIKKAEALRRYTYTWGGSITENFVQAQAGIIMKDQMVELTRMGYKVCLQVHDEVVVSVPEEHVEEAVIEIRSVMSTPPSWAPDLPVACEIGYHKQYGKVVKS